MKIVIGANGRLGSAICAALGSRDTLAPNRAIYENWWQPGMEATIGAYLDRVNSPVECILVAAGVIDPRASAIDHERINFHLPRQILRAAAPRRIRVVTFGTMMEVISSGVPRSAYVASKLALANEVQATRPNALHVRINTLYGGSLPPPHMFIGQMLDAIIARSRFLMSPGNQMREYHHVDDEAKAIIALISSTHSGAIDLNHGAPVTLAELARRTFEALGIPELLQIGALPAPVNERLDLEFVRHPTLRDCHFRDVLSAMPVYMRECLAVSQSRL